MSHSHTLNRASRPGTQMMDPAICANGTSTRTVSPVSIARSALSMTSRATSGGCIRYDASIIDVPRRSPHSAMLCRVIAPCMCRAPVSTLASMSAPQPAVSVGRERPFRPCHLSALRGILQSRNLHVNGLETVPAPVVMRLQSPIGDTRG